MRVDPDPVFHLAGVQDPFLSDPYLLALLSLPPKQRRLVVRQVVLLSATVGLDIPGALELLAKISPFVEVNRPDG